MRASTSASIRSTLLALGLIPGMLLSAASAAQTIPVVTLKHKPVLDGQGDDWADVEAQRVSLHSSLPTYQPSQTHLLIKAGQYADEVFFYLEWEDDQDGPVHKPYVWDDARGKYVRGEQREDRLAMQFRIKGDYTTDWLAGNDFTADMWHWKSSRSNPLGIAHDKLTVISPNNLLRAFKARGPNGPVYILRKTDAGDQPYTTKRYRQKDQPLMPKYVLNPKVSGSVADVKASGVWQGGKWRLELQRKLNTGHEDDVVFTSGQPTLGGIAIFDNSESPEHAISDVLTFQF